MPRAMKRAVFLLLSMVIFVGEVQSQQIHTEGMPPLMRASEAGRVDEVRRLLESGADVHERYPELGFTALMLASWRGHIDIVKLLLKAGSDPNAEGAITHGASFTPLIMAVGGRNENRLKVIDTLIAAGAHLNPPPPFDKSPLDAAIGQNDFGMVRALLKRGSDVNWEDGFGRTPLTTAVLIADRNVAMVRLLLKAGGDPNKPRIWNGDDCESILKSLDEELRMLRELRMSRDRVAREIRRLIIRAGGKSYEKKSHGKPCTPW